MDQHPPSLHRILISLTGLGGWLNVFNAESSRERYWPGPRSQEVGRGGGKGGGRGDYILSLHRHHQNDSCVKMGSDESHFNVPLIVRGKLTKAVPINHNF